MSAEVASVKSNEDMATSDSGSSVPANGKSKDVVLTPAGPPSVSAWGVAPQEVPVTPISMDLLDSNRKKKSSTVSSTSATKWVPMQATIKISDSSSGSRGSTARRQTRKKNQSNAKTAPKKTDSKKGKTKRSGLTRKSVPSEDDNADSNIHHLDHPESTTSTDLHDSAPGYIKIESENGKESVNGPIMHHGDSTRNGAHGGYSRFTSSRSYNKSRGTHHSSGPQRRRFHHNATSTDQGRSGNLSESNSPDGVVPFHKKSSHNYGHSHHPHSGYHNNYQFQQFPGFGAIDTQAPEAYFDLQPVLVAINNVARQIEYYFSDENLAKDEYLKSKLYSEGYAPLTLIAKFYRLANMSFGADPKIIMAALREIVINEEATVEVAFGSLEGEQIDYNSAPLATDSLDEVRKQILAPYFIRSKRWEKNCPSQSSGKNVDVVKVLSGGDLDQFMITYQPPMSFNDETMSAQAPPFVPHVEPRSQETGETGSLKNEQH